MPRNSYELETVITVDTCDLKVCDLCGYLNLKANRECHTCGWRGKFRTDPKTTRAAAILATQEMDITDVIALSSETCQTQLPIANFVDKLINRLQSALRRNYHVSK